jgi:hypothetical protein
MAEEQKRKRGRPRKVATIVSAPTAAIALDSVRYAVTMQVNNTEYHSEGENAYEALSNLLISATEAVTPSNVIMTKGDKKAELFLTLKDTRLLLGGVVRREGFAHRFEALL